MLSKLICFQVMLFYNKNFLVIMNHHLEVTGEVSSKKYGASSVAWEVKYRSILKIPFTYLKMWWTIFKYITLEACMNLRDKVNIVWKIRSC